MPKQAETVTLTLSPAEAEAVADAVAIVRQGRMLPPHKAAHLRGISERLRGIDTLDEPLRAAIRGSRGIPAAVRGPFSGSVYSGDDHATARGFDTRGAALRGASSFVETRDEFTIHIMDNDGEVLDEIHSD